MSSELLPAPAPVVSPEAKPFWDATAEGRLLLQRCASCETVIWYPRAFCPECASVQIEWFEASGRGVVYAYTVTRRGGTGQYREVGPYVLAYVETDEGPRLLTNIVGCNPDAVRVGDRVEAVFHSTAEGTALVRFCPLRPASKLERLAATIPAREDPAKPQVIEDNSHGYR